MKTALLATCAATLLAFGGQAFAADAACEKTAGDKKLAGAALASFMKKCEADAAGKKCDMDAKEKKLAGAAKNSFVKKCKADAMPAPAAKADAPKKADAMKADAGKPAASAKK